MSFGLPKGNHIKKGDDKVRIIPFPSPSPDDSCSDLFKEIFDVFKLGFGLLLRRKLRTLPMDIIRKAFLHVFGAGGKNLNMRLQNRLRVQITQWKFNGFFWFEKVSVFAWSVFEFCYCFSNKKSRFLYMYSKAQIVNNNNKT